jgi:hypothetical protein
MNRTTANIVLIAGAILPTLTNKLGSRNHPLDETVKAFGQQLQNEYGLTSAWGLPVHLYITYGGFLKLQFIRIPESKRGQGIGTAIMKQITDFADQHGLTMALTPAAPKNTVRAKNRLIRWYKSLGFIPNKGRNKDYGTRETMLRPPKLGSRNIRDKLSQIVVRPGDWQAASRQAYNYFNQLAAELPNSAWRGLTHAEYIATMGAGKGVKSRGDYSFDIEGTQFSAHPGDAESYINFGQDDPRATGIPTYMVEVDRSVLRLKPDGYWETAPGTAVPMQNILSVHRFIPRDGRIVAQRIR